MVVELKLKVALGIERASDGGAEIGDVQSQSAPRSQIDRQLHRTRAAVGQNDNE
jgi:hypothetical protein